MMDGKAVRKKLIGSSEERAVSPVIGVILMVAITVILAAVIAAFVLDMSPGGNQAPQANYDWSSNSGEVALTHSSGDDIDMSYVEIRIDYSSGSSDTIEFADQEFSVGNEFKITPDDTTNAPEYVVSLTGANDKTAGAAGTAASDVSGIDKVTFTWKEGDGGSIMTDYEP